MNQCLKIFSVRLARSLNENELIVRYFQTNPSLIDHDQINVCTINLIKTESIDGERRTVSTDIGQRVFDSRLSAGLSDGSRDSSRGHLTEKTPVQYR